MTSQGLALLYVAIIAAPFVVLAWLLRVYPAARLVRLGLLPGPGQGPYQASSCLRPWVR